MQKRLASVFRIFKAVPWVSINFNTHSSYANKIDQTGRKYIAIDEPQAGILRWSFEEIAKGVYNTEQVFKIARDKGFTGTKSLFWFAIRNPVYCGKIFVPKYKDDESRFVNGLHEPLIQEDLFYQVQDVLNGRKRSQYGLKVASNSTLPLRFFLICPTCGKILTGSISKGHSRYYSYYHCSAGCTFRCIADEINQKFVYGLKKYIPRPEMVELYKILLQQTWHDQTAHLLDDRKQLLKQIKELTDKLSYIRDLLSSKQIEPEDFREMKSDCNARIEKLEAKLSSLSHNDINIKDLFDKGIDILLKLDYIYETADVDKKREVISSIFPEKLHFEKSSLRTDRVNEFIKFIYLIDSNLGGNKKGQIKNKFDLSCNVGMAGFEPAASTSQMWRDTGLRYIPFPIGFAKV